MSPQAKWEYYAMIHVRYHKAKSRKEKGSILDEFCRSYGCHRKHALRLLNAAPPDKQRPARKPRGAIYVHRVIEVLEALWEASGYLWSTRLKAALPLWLPYIRARFSLSPLEERQLLSISPSQIDRRLKRKKVSFKKKIYGKTKPGTLLKHQIPIQTSCWNQRVPGYVEADLVSHSGNCASGEFAYTLDITDLSTQWVERRAFLGKTQEVVCQAIQDIEAHLPFKLRGFDSDNDSPFINGHLWNYCRSKNIQFTRSRPYKKNDNAHIEQKNWTHVRQLVGYLRYDTQAAVDALNDLYRNELRHFQLFFQPSIKLKKKERIGSRIKRRYDQPQTPFQRLVASKKGDGEKLQELRKTFDSLDPFALSEAVDRKLHGIFELASKPSRHPALLKTTPRREYDPMPRSELRMIRNMFPDNLGASRLETEERIYQKEKFLQTW